MLPKTKNRSFVLFLSGITSNAQGIGRAGLGLKRVFCPFSAISPKKYSRAIRPDKAPRPTPFDRVRKANAVALPALSWVRTGQDLLNRSGRIAHTDARERTTRYARQRWLERSRGAGSRTCLRRSCRSSWPVCAVGSRPPTCTDSPKRRPTSTPCDRVVGIKVGMPDASEPTSHQRL